MSKKCISCGAQLDDEALFCDICGKQQSDKTYEDLIVEEKEQKEAEERIEKERKLLEEKEKRKREALEELPGAISNLIGSAIKGVIISFLLGAVCYGVLLACPTSNWIYLVYIGHAFIIGGYMSKRLDYFGPAQIIVTVLVTAVGILVPFSYYCVTGSGIGVVIEIFKESWIRIVSVVVSLIVSAIRVVG